MAGNTLKLKFGTASGTKTFSFPNATTSPTSANVKALAQKMIENGSIYKYPPLELQSAVIEIVSENVINITD